MTTAPERVGPATAAPRDGAQVAAGGGYTPAQAARLTGASRGQVEYWRTTGLVAPSAGYEFRDLVALRLIVSLLDAGLALTRVRRALEYLRDAGEDPGSLRLVTDGESVWACRDDAEILDALREGQLAFFVAVDRVAAEIDAHVLEFARERDHFVADLRARDA